MLCRYNIRIILIYHSKAWLGILINVYAFDSAKMFSFAWRSDFLLVDQTFRFYAVKQFVEVGCLNYNFNQRGGYVV